MKAQLRAVTSRNAEIANLARDTSAALDTLVSSRIVKLTQLYTEPMTLALDHEPEALVLLRCRHEEDQEGYLPCGGVINFVYRPGTVEITAIEGLTVDTRYLFTFEVVG